MSNVTIKIEKVHPRAELPKKAHSTDAGYDLVAADRNATDMYVEYDLGFRTEIPEGYYAEIVPRSSISNYDMIMCNAPGIIDSAYRGNWKVRFKVVKDRRNTKRANIYKQGERIAQVIFRKEEQVSFEEASVSKISERGTGGFGSTNITLENAGTRQNTESQTADKALS